MSSLLMAQYFTTPRTVSVEGRPSSKLRRRLGAPPTLKGDATRSCGGSAVRRICTVRASASGEPRREQKHGLDLRRDATTRYQWQWNEDQTRMHSWNHTNPFDRESAPHFTPSSSEVWDCYNSSVAPQATGGNNGDTSIEETSSSESNAMTPEREFLSYAMKLPRPQFNGIDLMNSRESKGYNGTKEVYVLLFGVGEAPTEGIYSLRTHCHETGLHYETVLCFESSEDAARFSGLLEASMPHVSTVHTIKSSELIQFCSNSGYDCRLELEGSTLMPPEFNVGITDWERSLKLRQGHFQVLDEEPCLEETPTDDVYRDQEDSSLLDEAVDEGIFSQIDEVRAALERLLPEDDST